MSTVAELTREEQRGFQQTLERIRKSVPSPLPPRPQQDVQKIQAGGVVQFGGNTFSVLRRHRYTDKKGKYQWHELHLKNLITGDECFLEWEIDDELVITISRKITLRDLHINAQWLEEVGKADDESATTTFEGGEFKLDECGLAWFYADCGSERTEFRFFDFENRRGDKFVGAEIWDDGSVEASVSRLISADEIEILILGG